MDTEISRSDEFHLRRCIDLAGRALENGDDPFGSVLVDAAGTTLAEAMNRENTYHDPTAHPELALARWAAAHLSTDERRAATVYTSGEHCPMCAAAHGWAGMGRVVAAASGRQLAEWRASWGLPPGPVAPLPLTEVAPDAAVVTPVTPFDTEMRELHRRAQERTAHR